VSNELDRRIAAHAITQHGLITRKQALALGMSIHMIQSRRRSGRWTTVESGVYLLQGAPRTWHTEVLAACFALGGIASHRTAAALHRLDGFRPDIIEITIPRGRAVIRPGIVLHEATDLHLFRPIRIAGIPTTPLARLAVDLGSVISFRRYDAVIAEMVRRKEVSWDDLLDQLIRHSRRGRNGVGALRAVLDLHFGEDVGESVLEGAFLRELRRRGLPEPVAQYSIHDRDGFVARVDFCYPELRIVIELDGRRFHGEPVFESDRLKRDRLGADGWSVQEISRRMLLADPTHVFDRIERIIERATSASNSKFQGS
jgi:predicted transcriptional regulator of viral defense system